MKAPPPIAEHFDRTDHEARYHRAIPVAGHNVCASTYLSAYRDGMTIDEIAEEAGVKPAIVKKVLTANGVPIEKLLTRDERFFKGLFGPLFRATDVQAAEVMNWSPGRVQQVRRRLGIACNRSLRPSR